MSGILRFGETLGDHFSGRYVKCSVGAGSLPCVLRVLGRLKYCTRMMSCARCTLTLRINFRGDRVMCGNPTGSGRAFLSTVGGNTCMGVSAGHRVR